jgi:hypothetical protein
MTEIYDQILELTGKAFEQQMYETAYHLLNAGVHAAKFAHDIDALQHLQALAVQHRKYIDRHAPKNVMSSQSAKSRGGINFYDILIRTIEADIAIIKADKIQPHR